MKIKNPQFERNVRLDDRTRNFVMDFSSDKTCWTTVMAAEARKSLDKRKKKSWTQQELDEIIGTSDFDSSVQFSSVLYSELTMQHVTGKC